MYRCGQSNNVHAHRPRFLVSSLPVSYSIGTVDSAAMGSSVIEAIASSGGQGITKLSTRAQIDPKPTLLTPDPLVCQIVLALKTVLETDATNSCFYAESMATAMAAHLLRNYSTRKHILPRV